MLEDQALCIFVVQTCCMDESNTFVHTILHSVYPALIVGMTYSTCMCIYFHQLLEDNFDVKQKVQEILTENDYDKKRARTMDIDDFLG